jgi:uncharacterized membrane protein YphA (DoxX/SURF4 family)/predicted DCC family thiol-disulfide oxidoreductase YuxK
VPAQGLALFRIFFGIVFFCETAQMFYFRELIFDPIPFIKAAEIDTTIPLIVWSICIFCIIIGAFTRQASLINYIFTLIFISALHQFEYHIDYSYIAINFLLIFVPSGRSFSIDRLFEKLKYSTSRDLYIPPSTTSILSYLSIVGMGIGLVYFDSLFSKLASPMWLNGLGFWLPTSIPFVTFWDMSPILNIKWLAIFLGYLTLIFEGVFLFGIWERKYRIPLTILGVGLHIGILFTYPIPWFALSIIGLYILLLPYEWWPNFHQKLKRKTPSLTIYYDEKSSLSNRVKIIFNHFDFWGSLQFKGFQTHASSDTALKEVSKEALLYNIYSVNNEGKIYEGLAAYVQIFARIWFLWPMSVFLRLPLIKQIASKIYGYVVQSHFGEVYKEENSVVAFPSAPPQYDRIKLFNNVYLRDIKVASILFFTLFCVAAQSISITRSLLIDDLGKKLGIETYVKKVKLVAVAIKPFTHQFLGITEHAVFIDRSHFDGFNHMVSVSYVNPQGEEIWLPIINKNGQVGSYNTGRQWKGWVFCALNRTFIEDRFYDMARKYTAFWAKKNGVSLKKKAIFKFRVKKNDSVNAWKYNFLRDQMDKPWVYAGQMVWENHKCSLTIVDVDKL